VVYIDCDRNGIKYVKLANRNIYKSIACTQEFNVLLLKIFYIKFIGYNIADYLGKSFFLFYKSYFGEC